MKLKAKRGIRLMILLKEEFCHQKQVIKPN